jgi:hypothetical protein
MVPSDWRGEYNEICDLSKGAIKIAIYLVCLTSTEICAMMKIATKISLDAFLPTKIAKLLDMQYLLRIPSDGKFYCASC